MDRKPVQQQTWFRGTVGVLTLLCGIALFSFAGLGIHSLVTAVIAFLCLMGLERVLSALLGMVVVLLQARRTGSS
jgi:uncharacterized membrane protein HdeD (DUF308 family)